MHGTSSIGSLGKDLRWDCRRQDRLLFGLSLELVINVSGIVEFDESLGRIVLLFENCSPVLIGARLTKFLRHNETNTIREISQAVISGNKLFLRKRNEKV